MSVQEFGRGVEDIHNMLDNIIIRSFRLHGAFGVDKFLQGT
jgi:hypothetical protein